MNFYWVVDYTRGDIQGPFLTVEQASVTRGYQLQALPGNDVRVVRQEMIWLSDEQIPEPVYPEAPEDVTEPEEQP